MLNDVELFIIILYAINIEMLRFINNNVLITLNFLSLSLSLSLLLI